MKLQVPTREDCQIVRLWRNDCLVSLRTPYGLTEEMQNDFYKNTICNRNSPHRYWSIYDGKKFIGFGGIVNIQWENSLGEISLIINPKYRKKGYGDNAVDLLLIQAFNYLGLLTIYGECYICNPEKDFWEKIVKRFKGDTTILKNRKFWNGEFYDSLYFSITL